MEMKLNSLVSCGAYYRHGSSMISSSTDAAAAVWLSSTDSIRSQHFEVLCKGWQCFVSLTDLTPSSRYDVYCMTVSLSGNEMPVQVATANHLVAETRCCKMVKVFQTRSFVNTNTFTENVLKVSGELPPAEGGTTLGGFTYVDTPVTATLHAVYNDSQVVVEQQQQQQQLSLNAATLYPSAFTLSSQVLSSAISESKSNSSTDILVNLLSSVSGDLQRTLRRSEERRRVR